MDVIELVPKGHSDVLFYMCGNCYKIHGFFSIDRFSAVICCRPSFCDCGVEMTKGMRACNECEELNRAKKAKCIAVMGEDGFDWDRYVCARFSDGGYTGTIGSLMDDCSDEEREPPFYVYACIKKPFRICLHEALEDHLDHCHYDDAEDELIELGDMCAIADLLDEWVSKQTLANYRMDYKKIIVIDQERFDAYIGKEIAT